MKWLIKTIFFKVILKIIVGVFLILLLIGKLKASF